MALGRVKGTRGLALQWIAIMVFVRCHAPARVPENSMEKPASSALPSASELPSYPAPAPVTADPSASASTSAAALVPATSSASAPSTKGPLLPGRLAHFFAGYTDRSDFEFMRLDCAPQLKMFISLRNVGVDDVIRDAKRFFRDKRKLSYRPDERHMRVEAHAGGQVVRLPVEMSWWYPIPKEWGTDWPTWDDEPHVARHVTADVEIELDADGRILRYVERSVEKPRLRVTGEDNCEFDERTDIPKPQPWLKLTPGNIVRDLGESVVVSVNAKGADTARKVRYENEDGWTLESTSFSVENPFGGTSAGSSQCLAPVKAP